jgi:hypothetical protein
MFHLDIAYADPDPDIAMRLLLECCSAARRLAPGCHVERICDSDAETGWQFEMPDRLSVCRLHRSYQQTGGKPVTVN